jgi:hypothetical protein
MNQSTEVKELFTALNKAQGQIKGAVKDANNPFFKSKYADLESVWDACRDALTKNGLSVIQTTEYNLDAGTCVVTTLAHNSGQWIRGSLPIMAVKPDPQGVGSAITYARRYALAAIVGVVQVDDDAESAMSRSRVVPQREPTEGDGYPSTTYTVPFGKFMKRTLEEIDPKQLAGYIIYLEEQAVKKQQPLSGQVHDFVERASAHLAAFEQTAARAVHS